MKVCLEPGCPTLTSRSRCAAHKRQRDRERGSASARGYGVDHRALRTKIQKQMDSGRTFTCWRCGNAIDPRHWDLGHRDDRNGYAGPECVACNRATSGRGAA